MGVETAIIAAAALSAGSAIYAADKQDDAQKKASQAQIEAQAKADAAALKAQEEATQAAKRSDAEAAQESAFRSREKTAMQDTAGEFIRSEESVSTIDFGTSDRDEELTSTSSFFIPKAGSSQLGASRSKSGLGFKV